MFNNYMKRLTLICSALFCYLALPAQDWEKADPEWLGANYTKREVMVPMRDGVSLYTAVYEPVGREEPAPVIICRTPYSLKPYGKADGIRKPYSGGIRDEFLNYAADKYVIVFQNVRGRYLSEGDYENIRPVSSDPAVSDDATDSYDTVEWLLANTENNGRVGVKGVSYPGFYATLAALSGHPAIKAVSPQAPVTDWFMGDDAHHNGALCLADAYRFGSSMYRERRGPSAKGLPALFSTKEDLYTYFRGRPISELNAFFGDSLKFWSRMMEHPDYDDFWKDRDPSVRMRNVRPAMLVVGGFYDAEDCYGAFRTYRMLRKLSPDTETYLAAGPWYHGGWTDRSYAALADSWFGEGSASYYLDNVEYPFFRHYLEGEGNPPAGVNVLPSAETMRDRNGAGSWTEYSQWPPAGVKYRRLGLTSADSLDLSCITGEKPSAEIRKGSRSFVSDPQNPVPYMDIVSSSRNKGYMTADQRFASAREDVLTYWGRTLRDTVHVAGGIDVNLALTLSSGDGRKLDGDIVVKLIDVRPDGVQMLVRGDVMPLRYRKGFSSPVPAKDGKKLRVAFTMPDIDHYFLPGHRLMVQVQASWFPLIAFNPQTYLENQYAAAAADYLPVTVGIEAGGSFLSLPVLD